MTQRKGESQGFTSSAGRTQKGCLEELNAATRLTILRNLCPALASPIRPASRLSRQMPPASPVDKSGRLSSPSALQRASTFHVSAAQRLDATAPETVGEIIIPKPLPCPGFKVGHLRLRRPQGEDCGRSQHQPARGAGGGAGCVRSPAWRASAQWKLRCGLERAFSLQRAWSKRHARAW